MEVPEQTTQPPRILALDDQLSVLITIRTLLEDYGYEVESTENPAQAVYMAEHSRFDAVIIDQLLPEQQTGLEVLREIRKIHHGQPAIIISGVPADRELLQEIDRLGAIFIHKPNIRAILEKLQMMLEFERNPIKVFISYANSDSSLAIGIYTRLRDNGFKPWIDKRDLPLGLDFERELQKRIDDSDFVISCLSDVAVERPMFKFETRIAIARHDQVGEPFVLPIRFGNCKLPAEFIERKLHYIDYDDRHDDWWHRLVKTLRSKRL